MSPAEISPSEIKYLPNNLDANPEAMRELLYSYATAYRDEYQVADTNDQARPTSKDFDDGYAGFKLWADLNPKEIKLVDEKWNERLGIGFTNNFYIWFVDTTPEQGYDLDNPTSQADKPALTYLANLKADDPEFFEACREAATQLRSYMGNNPDSEISNSNQDNPEQRILDGIVANWISELLMHQVIHRLTQAGASQEAIKTLYS